MLKVKNDIDLKELKKFGFDKCLETEYGDYKYTKLEEETNQYLVIIDRKLEMGLEFYQENLDMLVDIICDLTQAGIIEKTNIS